MANDPAKPGHHFHIDYADAVYKNALNSLLFIDNEGLILEANPASSSFFGCSINEITNHSIFELAQTDKTTNLELFFHAFIKGLQKETIISFYNKKAENKRVAISGSPNIDKNIHLLIIRDLSSYTETELKLAQSEQRLNAIIETGQECIKLLGPQCELLEINSAGLAMLETDSDANILGKSVLEFIEEKYRADFLRITQEVYQGHAGSLDYEMNGMQGGHHWLQMKAVPLFSKDKQSVNAMLCVTQKLTERKKAEDSLLQSEKTLNNIFEFSPIPLLISRVSDGRVIMANKGIEKMVGKSKSQLIGDLTSNYYADQEERKIIVDEMLTKGEILGRELRIKDAQGNVKLMLIYVHFLIMHNENMLLSSFIDITERRQKDALIEKTKNDLASIVNMLPDLLFRFDEDNRFIFYHTNNKDSLLAPPELFIGKKAEDVLPPELANLVNAKLNITRNSNTLEIFEYSLEKEATEWYECRMLNTNNKEVLAIIRNVTLQKEGELAIKESERKFRSLVQDLTVGVFVQDKNRKTILHNHAALELLGVTEEELVNTQLNPQGWEIRQEDGSSFDPKEFPITKAFSTLRPYRNVTIGIKSLRNPNTVWLSVDAIPMTDEKGNLMHVVCTLYDITIKKKAKEALHKSEDNLRTVFENTEVAYILFNTDIKILSFNENAQLFTQKEYKKTLAEGKRLFDYTPKERESDLIELTQKVLEGQTFEYDISMTKESNETVWFHLKYSPVYNKTKHVSGFVLSIEDITERKNNELALINSLGLVTEQNERLLNFSYIVSHNLRSHTSNIKMILNLLEEEQNENEKKELLENLKSVSELLNETIYNLNDVVSIQNNINNISEPLNLKNYTLQAIEILQKQAQLKKVTIKNNIIHDTIIDYNPAYLESILLNFISNAIKYSDSNKTAWVEIDSYTEKNKTIIQIKDNGIGMDLQKNGDKLFGMYKTFHGNSDARGLGLFISKNQIESMGGYINVESQPGQGSTFKIYLK